MLRNLNDLAKIICAKEGKKKQLPIGQVKEVLKIICDICADMPITMMKLLWRL